jgi:hypothetical protein
LTLREFYANINLGKLAVDTGGTTTIRQERRPVPRQTMQRRRALAFARVKAKLAGLDRFGKRVRISWHEVRRSSSEPQGEASAVTVAPFRSATTRLCGGPFVRVEAGSGRRPAADSSGTRA